MSRSVLRLACQSSWLSNSPVCRKLLNNGKLIWIKTPVSPWHVAIRRTDVPSSQGFATLAQGCKRSMVTNNKEFEVFLVPNRSFGRKKLIQRYGHAASNDRLWWISPMIVFIIGASFLFIALDWKYLEYKYGIKIFPDELLEITHHDGSGVSRMMLPIQIDTDETQGKNIQVAQEYADIHAFMKIRAIKDKLSSLAEEDEEFAGILVGDEIKERTKHYEAKKEYIDNALVEISLLEKIAMSPDQATIVPEPDRERKSTLERLDDFFKPRRAKAETAINHLESEEERSGRYEMQAIDSDEEADCSKDGLKVGFKARRIITYENRIRSYSTPDKIFRYFATIKVVDDSGHQEVMMSPQDFLRSITPGIPQPEDLGLDNFLTISADQIHNVYLGVDQDSIFHQLGSGGLISFSDYVFLLTVLSTSRRHFEIAFKMFDLNGDGDVDAKEFQNVTNIMRSQSSMGARHRDHQASTLKTGINSGLTHFFFGPDAEGILTVDKFLQFQRHLQTEILKLEFERKAGSGVGSKISESDFAELLIVYAGFPEKKKSKMLKRVKRSFGGANESSEGVTLDDYLNFYQVLYAINDIDTALTFHTMAGAPIERSTMKHVAKTVAGVQLSQHLVDVVFVLFDENGDGKLSNREFISVMKQRAMRGLEKPKDTGVGKFFSAITKCASPSNCSTGSGGHNKT